MDEEASLLNASPHEEDAILKSPQGSTTSRSPDTGNVLDTSASSATGDAVQHKKIILKRKLHTEISVSESESESTKTESIEKKVAKTDADNNENGTKAVVKLSELTMKERLELRAKKFGALPSTEALKTARAERFGLSKDNANGDSKSENSGKLSTAGTAVSVDVLKKRAERFGGSVSTVMNKIDNAEKLKKRGERFGDALETTKTDTTASTEYDAKAKARLERFKTSA